MVGNLLSSRAIVWLSYHRPTRQMKAVVTREWKGLEAVTWNRHSIESVVPCLW